MGDTGKEGEEDEEEVKERGLEKAFPPPADYSDPGGDPASAPPEHKPMCPVCGGEFAGGRTSRCGQCGRFVHRASCLSRVTVKGGRLCNTCCAEDTGAVPEPDRAEAATEESAPEGAFADPPAPPEEADDGSEFAGFATPGLDRAKVGVMVERVGTLLQRISQLSVGPVYPGDEIQGIWIELASIGRILKGMGGTQLQREVINKVRRDHTQLSRSLEVNWLGDWERRLP